MNESLFIEYVRRIFPKLGTLIEKINGKRKVNLTYLHKEMLRLEYSADQKWESAGINTTYVAADVVAMDSPLPPKKRDSIAHANGKLPKIGMKKIFRETQINSVNIMKARGEAFANIANKLVMDANACSVGIDERNEYNFLTALSEGVVLIEDEDNVGTALRVNFNFLEENTFGVKDKGILTLEDMKAVLDKADSDGNSIIKIMMSKSRYNSLRSTRGARELVADAQGRDYTDDTNLPLPTSKSFNSAFEDEFGATIQVVDRCIKIEKNDVIKTVKPWSNNKITYLCDANEVGALVYGTLAEETNKVNGVEYQKIDTYKLISKYSKTDPLQEFTAGQALVLPVLENIDQIYSQDVNVSESVNEEAEKSDTEDVYITIGNKKYSKPAFVEKMNSVAETSLVATSSDEDLIAAFNELDAKTKKEILSSLSVIS